MMKFLLFITIVGISFNIQAQLNPTVFFKKMTHDYGIIKEEIGEVKAVFTFKNTGNAPLFIENVFPSCGCTTAKYTKTAVLPGKKGSIEAVYHTKNSAGSFHKTIIVYTNDSANKSVVLNIVGTVTPKGKTMADDFEQSIGNISFKSNHVAFNQIKNTTIKTDTLWFYNAGQKKLDVTFVNPHQWLTLSKSVFRLKPAKKDYVLITYNANKRNDWGLNFDKIIMKTNDDTLADKNIFVSAQIEEDFSQLTSQQIIDAPGIKFERTTYDFGEIKEGKNLYYDFAFVNTGKTDLILRKIKTSCGCTSATIDNTIIKTGYSGKISVIFYSKGKTGEQQNTITVITNDPDHAIITLSLTGVVNN